jgi:uncharacterized protein
VKIAVISDTHLPRGTRRLPDECLRRLDGADLILHGGDFVAASVLDELGELAPVEAVFGNMDEPVLKERLPRRHVVEAAGVRIGMVHIPGPLAGREQRLAEWFPGCHAVVYGHTHVAELVRYGDTLILNPGSPTERRRSPSRSMAMLAIGDGRVEAETVDLGS